MIGAGWVEGRRQAHHGEVAGGPVDMQLAQQFPGQGHLVGGGVVGHIQPLHVLHQGLLVVLLPEQVIALGEQVLHQLEQKGLPGGGGQRALRGLSPSSPSPGPRPLPLLDTPGLRLPPARQAKLTSYSSCFRGSVDLAGKGEEHEVGMSPRVEPHGGPGARARPETMPAVGSSSSDLRCHLRDRGEGTAVLAP